MTDSFELKPVCGGEFYAPITPASEQVILFKTGINIIFSRAQEGFGANFDWNELDLSGLHFGKSAGDKLEYFIKIQPGCWLSKKLNNEKCAIEVQVTDGKKIIMNSRAITEDDGKMKQKLPQCFKGFVGTTWQVQSRLCFYLRKTCALTIKV